MELTALLAEAGHVGLRFAILDDGHLQIVGPRAAEPLARKLLEGYRDQLRDWLICDRVALDWSDSTHWLGGRRPACIHCGVATCLAADDGQPSHKLCAEHLLTIHLRSLLAPTEVRAS